MNIEKIFKALEENEMDSALGIIVVELELQGYSVHVYDIPVTSDEIFDGKYDDIYKLFEPVAISVYKNDSLEQEFEITFNDYHEISFRKREITNSKKER
jgi:hypothetical protein